MFLNAFSIELAASFALPSAMFAASLICLSMLSRNSVTLAEADPNAGLIPPALFTTSSILLLRSACTAVNSSSVSLPLL